MDMKEEMMNDAIDDVTGEEEDDEERYTYDLSKGSVHNCRQLFLRRGRGT